MELSQNQAKILQFIEDFALKHLEIPSVARIYHEIDVQNYQYGTIDRIVASLYNRGDIAPIVEKLKKVRERRAININSNRPDWYTAGASRTGVKEVSRRILHEKAYSVNVMKAKFECGIEWKFAFTVDHSRGFTEYKQVKKQPAVPVYTEYAESLLDGMFKNWK